MTRLSSIRRGNGARRETGAAQPPATTGAVGASEAANARTDKAGHDLPGRPHTENRSVHSTQGPEDPGTANRERKDDRGARRPYKNPSDPYDLREHILATASGLFYREGVRAVGVDRVVAVAGIAKTSLYRHFPTKDDLIVAFLEREDREFWGLWDSVSAAHVGDPRGELDAQLRWIGERLSRANYRGCPQINVASEFAESAHPSREVARTHMRELRKRLTVLAKGLRYSNPERLAAQLALLVNGAFVSAELLSPTEAVEVLLDSADALVARRA